MVKQVGRPRDSEVDDKIIRSTLDLLSKNTPESLSIESISKHAGVGKTSIYRRYKNKDDIVVAALSKVKTVDLKDLDFSKSALEVILQISDRFIQTYNNPTGRSMIAMSVNTLIADEQLSNKYWDNTATPLILRLVKVIRKLQDQNKLSNELDSEIISETLTSIFMAQFLLLPQSQVKKSLERILTYLFATWK